jgi:SAM-dependent methyltransferase
VLREALRLYPPVWAIGRRSTAEYTLAGYEIPEGSIFLLSPYLVHRDPRHFAHPSSFDPSRWEPEEEAARPRYASFPFGGGPRQCPGADFALLEARLLLATIVSRWQIEESPDKPARPAFLLVLRPRPGFDVRVRARDTALTSEAAPEEIAHVGVWQASPGQRLWRAHSDAVNSELVERWLPAGLGRVLKTDLWDEAVGGGLVPALRALAARIDAIDVAGEVAEAAQSHYPELGVTVADVRRMPFADETFDAVVSNSTLDHFGSAIEIKASLSEIARVLRPGGALVLTLDNPRNLLVAATKALPRTQLNRLWLRHSAVFGRLGLLPYQVGVTVGPRRLRRMLEWAGFEVELQEEIVHCPRLPAVVLGHVLETVGPAWSETAFTRLLAASERLGSLPLSGLTGNFVAVRARKL